MLERRTLLYPVVFSIVFTTASLPFLLGMMRPAFEDKNPYALLYSFFNYPATILLDGFVHWFTTEMWGYPTFPQLQMTTFFTQMIFWTLIGMIIGFYKDLREGSGS